MKTTSRYTAERNDEIIDVWLDLDCECKYDDNGNEMIKEWLEDQNKEVAEFEKNNPNIEALRGDGNSVEYRGKAIDFINAGINIEINSYEELL